MSFEVSVADNDRFEALLADGRWHRLKIAGKALTPVSSGKHILTIHLYGLQARKRDGTLWLRFVRSDGDSTAWCAFPVDMDDPDFGAVLTTLLDIAADINAIGVDYKTKVPGLKLKNRVFKMEKLGG